MTSVDTIEPPITTPHPPGGWTRSGAITVVFLAALACFLPLPPGSPLAGTEGHRAITAHQMVQSGEWLVPRMYGRVYLAKPPLHYWILASYEKLTGVAAPFIWRLPSAVEGSILAATLCWLAWRWFGGIAGIVSGFGYIALVAMWGQDRGADIDLTNALVSTLAAICLLEMQFGPTAGHPGSRVWYTLLGGLAIGASFLTKGPCGLPPILGSMIWIAIASTRQQRVNRLLRPSFWLPLLIGAAIFGVYAFATYHYIHSHHMAADLTGVQEGTEDLHPHDWSVSRAIGIVLLPLTMFVYALPISLGLPLSFLPEIRRAQGDEQRPRMQAIAWTILLAWAVCFVSGMHLPRYAYVTLPLLCPLAGAVAASIPRLRANLRRMLAAVAGASAMILALVVLALAVMLWRHPQIRPLLIITSIIALALGVLVLRALLTPQPNWRALYALPLILLCLSLSSAYMVHYDRKRRSSLEQGNMIRGITGPNAQLYTCAMVLDQPELFYYAGLPTRAFDGDNLDWHDIPSGSWVVLEPQELQIWQQQVPNRIKRTIPFTANKNPGDLVWYADETATSGS